MKTTLVTGANGFVGSHFVRYLENTGWDVAGVDIAWSTDCLDVFESERTQYDLVVHAAATAPNRVAIDKHPGDFPYNVMLDSTMFDWAIRTAQPRVLYLSSCAVYPAILQGWQMRKPFIEDFVGYDSFYLSDAFPFGIDPTPIDRYGWTKLIGEHMARATNEASQTRVTVVRPFSGYGSDQSDLFPFRAFLERARAKANPFEIWGSGKQIRDWIHIDDIVKACMTLVDAKVTEPVNLCTGIGTSMNELVFKMLSAIKYNAIVRTNPGGEHRGADFRVGDPAKLKTYYTPSITLDEGIARAFKGE